MGSRMWQRCLSIVMLSFSCWHFGADCHSAMGQPDESRTPDATKADATGAVARTWTSANGRYETRAVLVERVGSKVKLRKENGSVVTVDVEQLSQADRDYLRDSASDSAAPSELFDVAEKAEVGSQSPIPGLESRPEFEKLGALSGHEGGIRQISISGDGNRAASIGQDDQVRIWDTENMRQLGVAEKLASNEVTCLVLSADGTRLLAGCQDGAVQINDLATGETIARIEGHRGRLTHLFCSSDGEQFVSVGEDTKVRRGSVADGASERVGHIEANKPFDFAAATEDLRFGFVGHSDALEVHPWDLSSADLHRGRTRFQIQGIRRMAMQSHSRILSATSQGRIYLHSMTEPPMTGGELFVGTLDIETAAVALDGTYAVLGDLLGSVWYVNDPETGGESYRLPIENATTVALSGDIRTISYGDAEGRIHVWRLAELPPTIAERRSTFVLYVLGLLENEEYDALEELATRLSLDHDTLPWGPSNGRLEFFYGVLGRSDLTSRRAVLDREQRLELWKSRRVDSPTPLQALAEFYIGQAWNARGSGTADTVSAEGWRQFHAGIGRARELLVEARKLPARRIHNFMHSYSILPRRNHGRDPSEKRFSRS